MNKKIILLFILVYVGTMTMPEAFAQHYFIDTRNASSPLIKGQLCMGNPGPSGKALLINNQYMTIGGKPVIPVMGEIHFSRYPRNEWEDVLLKMKACGITIISTYVFWIYHEEIEGQYDWHGNKDLRYFLALCKKLHLMAVVRIGPWCHGEVRNGGLPDWILQKRYIHLRSNDPEYQYYVQQWYNQVAAQLKGLLYKDNGPVIGVQLENEYRHGKQGEAHIEWLKQTAIKAGIDVPMYTVTGWGNASVPKNQVIPLFGGYPGAPWNTNLDKIANNTNYIFTTVRNEEGIGNEMKLADTIHYETYHRYPYFTCELGVGNEVTYHRRPVFSDIDGLAIATAKLGSGSNLIGYYMFAGGTNEKGQLTSLEENQDETGYPNRYPKISYDFQAAVKESGELSPAYFQLKKFHYFLNEFGSRLALMTPVIKPSPDVYTKLQYAVRAEKDTGYVFGINYYRGYRKPIQKQVQFTLQLQAKQLTFPHKPVDITDSCIFIWPYNFRMNDVILQYATATPLCVIKQPDATDWFFTQTKNIMPELSFDTTAIQSIESNSGHIEKERDHYLLTGFTPGIAHHITIKDRKNNIKHLFILSYKESLHVWLFHRYHQKIGFLSNANLYLQHNSLHVYSSSPHVRLIALNNPYHLTLPGDLSMQSKKEGFFTTYDLHFKRDTLNYQLVPKTVLLQAQWLSTAIPVINAGNTLYHKFFIKEFSVSHASEIKSATLYLSTGLPCSLAIDHKWLNQPVSAETLNELDLTGYLKNGDNTLMIDFPFVKNDTAFAARIKIDYYNTDQINFYSDTSWLTTVAYVPPAPWESFKNLKPAIVKHANLSSYSQKKIFPIHYWELFVPHHFSNSMDNGYLHLKYTGNRATCRLDDKLIDDSFNNGSYWNLSLKRYGEALKNVPLLFHIYAFKPNDKIYFDSPMQNDNCNQVNMNKIILNPEYYANILVNYK
ncbi:beta-galactosidase [Microbacter margulisiae]|uniref:Glycoside hydrolase 35 catalytic domain-containing protein n=1 Tax=Microbacter margulisiae TaxID=1350067 RepID=A0A7W5H1S2_9PORP|nr:beta-galactosidase [Microbacter margulisiae]MBB3186980.1 hypothetical protein [Microbacter margulisiae]